MNDSLAGKISIIPVGIEFPKKGLFEIAIDILEGKWIFLGALEDVSTNAYKPDVKNIGVIFENS